MIKTLLKYLFRLIWIPTELFFAILFCLFTYILYSAHIEPPTVPNTTIGKREKVGPNHYVLGNNYLRKNEFGIWEMYLEGEPYERGLVYGELAKELVQEQEDIFVAQINQFIPNGFWRQSIKLFVGFFNSDLPENIPLENQQEIYGISQSFSDEYNYVAAKYTRILNYHAAHDIGHALNDYSMVGCTSFALKGTKTENQELMVGRNFDFYVGDEFAKNKLVIFVNPSKGYKFASYSWAGFTGVASGMNEKGLTVTINASKSDLPTGSKMPISLLAREILQYAGNIKEAIAIAKKRQTFVSETLMIASSADGKAVLIEKSPTKMGVYESNTDQLVCSNHYQSTTFKKDPINIDNIKQSDSKFRYSRVDELLKKQATFNPTSIAALLRDQLGEHNDTLGLGNPRAINQLIAHHSVIFVPNQRLFYISSSHFQLGSYLAYDLNKTFKLKKAIIETTIPASSFIQTKAYSSFLHFKKVKQQISGYLLFDKSFHLSEKQVTSFITSNSESYVTYEMLGKYYMKQTKYSKAIHYFKQSLTKRVASKQIEEELKNLIKECQQAKNS